MSASCFLLIAVQVQQDLQLRLAWSNLEHAPALIAGGPLRLPSLVLHAHRKHDAAGSIRLFLAVLLRVSWSSSPLSYNTMLPPLVKLMSLGQ